MNPRPNPAFEPLAFGKRLNANIGLTEMTGRRAGKALLLVAALWTAEPALACSCVTVGPGEYDYRASLSSAAAVFRGTVLAVQDLKFPRIPPQDSGYFPYRMVVFDAREAWAGVNSRRVLVFTGTGGGDCGYSFKVGEEYIVWADRNDWRAPEELSTGICTFTAPVAEAAEQLRQLGKSGPLKQ